MNYPRTGHDILVHRQRAEKALGHPLPVGAVVHHADGSKLSDAPLVICPNQGYHKLLHVRMRVKAAGGDPNKDHICSDCGLKPKSEFSPNRHVQLGISNMCRNCHRIRENTRYARKTGKAA